MLLEPIVNTVSVSSYDSRVKIGCLHLLISVLQCIMESEPALSKSWILNPEHHAIRASHAEVAFDTTHPWRFVVSETVGFDFLTLTTFNVAIIVTVEIHEVTMLTFLVALSDEVLLELWTHDMSPFPLGLIDQL